MTHKTRWLAALTLLLAFSAATVRAEEEEEVAPPRPVVQILPPQGAPTALPYGSGTPGFPNGTPAFPGTAWSLPCPYPMPIAPVAAFVPYGPPCAGCPACVQAAYTEPVEYVVAVKMFKPGLDSEGKAVPCPRISLLEGQPATFQVNGVETPKEQSSFRINVTVTKQGDGAMLNLGVEDACSINAAEAGVRSHTEAMETHCHVTLGQSKKVELNHDSDGSPRCWIEVTVTEVEREHRIMKAACTGSYPCAKSANTADAHEGAVDGFAECVQCVFEIVADTASGLFGGEPQAPVTPASEYLQQPPSYFPAAPAAPMARELSSQEATCPKGATGCSKVVTAHAIGECDCPATGCGAGICQCAATEVVKQAGLHVVIDASKDRKCVEMTDGKKHIKASADQITVEGDSIELQGDVRVESCDDACHESTIITADTVHLERKDGCLKIKIDE